MKPGHAHCAISAVLHPGYVAQSAPSPAGVTTLNILDCQTDGFKIGDSISSLPGGSGSGSIVSVSNSQVTIAPVSSWASSVGKNIVVNGGTQSYINNSTVDLTSLPLPRSLLTPQTQYYARVQYFNSSSYSQYSPWSTFRTGNL
jgi:hypothetical protein